MLFNSYPFLFGFLPVTLALFFFAGRYWRRGAAGVLVLTSLFFYGWWNPAYVGLLLGSIAFNYGIGLGLARTQAIWSHSRRTALLVLGLAANLALLGYCKYANFFIDVTGAALPALEIVLPLGISFFTFTQITYLVDAYRGEAREYNPIHYALFVTYFPHLIAGPILHHREIMPQFEDAATYRLRTSNVVLGFKCFMIGLCKKVILADGIAPYANKVFAAAPGVPLTLVEAWTGAFAYTMQIYFDFSGYSDMAIGLAMMMNIRLPLNFASPYKATSIIDFWRRWHMTLSRFLRDYLYIPLGGNRRGPARRYVNVMITMLLGGLWHGAGWTFIVWGGLHGLFLVVNQTWRAMGLTMSPWAGRLLTFLAVVIAWVFFRADGFPTAFAMLGAMFGSNGLATFHNQLFAPEGALASIAVLLAIAWFAPNTQEITGYRPPGAEHEPAPPPALVFGIPAVSYTVVIGVLFVVALMLLDRESPFLYFQF
ncbi:MAG: MBOAT family protein [Rhodospirillales bacterium]|nr:MBOAT family protein [Rhodospirillales bacterium]